MLVVFLTVDSVPSGRVPGAWGDPPQVVVRITRSLTPSVGCRITGGTTSSGSKVTGIPQAQPSCFWSAAPHPWLSSQLFELCLSFPASPSPEKKKNSRGRRGEHTPSFIGGEYLQRQVEEKGSHGVGEIVGTRQTMGYRMTPASTPTPGRVGEQLGPRRRAGEG